MEMPIDQIGKHHPFCAVRYERAQGDWHCECELLREYDDWAQGPTAYDKGLEDGLAKKNS